MSPPLTSPTSLTRPITIWLDADPGHDDAIAMLLALYCEEEVELVGMSTVSGNAPLVLTHANAAQLLALYRAPKDLNLYRGRAQPLVKEYLHPPTSIHGHSGLDGVLHLPPLSHPTVQHFYTKNTPWLRNQFSTTHLPLGGKILDKADTDTDTDGESTPTATSEPTVPKDEPESNFIPSFHTCLTSLPPQSKIVVVITGPCTNLAAFKLEYEDVWEERVERVVVMGGCLGMGQWTPFAEFNIAVDPDALHILLQSPTVPVVLAPLNVTHQAIFGDEVGVRLLDPTIKDWKKGDAMPEPKSEFRESLSTMLTFFKTAYKNFGFHDGPPLHDPLTILHLTHPHLLRGRWCNLSVNHEVGSERSGELTAKFVTPDEQGGESGKGDEYGDKEKLEAQGEGMGKLNCYMLEGLDRHGFWEVVLSCVDKAEKRVESTPL